MALQFDITKEAHAALEEAVKGLYGAKGDGFRLDVSGLDPADELKEALRKEREERASAKAKLKEFEDASSLAERERLLKTQEFEKLYKKEQENSSNATKQLDDLRSEIAQKDRNSEALKITSALATDTARGEILQQQAMSFISHTPEGIKINGPDGQAWDANQLSDHLKEKYPFLVDGSKASGGGATGGNGGGAAKGYKDYNAAELSELNKSDPAAYKRILAER